MVVKIALGLLVVLAVSHTALATVHGVDLSTLASVYVPAYHISTWIW
jgi:hypothetical protein